VVADRGVVVNQFFAGIDGPRRADPDRLVRDLDPAIGRARVIDEPGDVAADERAAAPGPVDPEDPEAALLQILRLAPVARLAVANELAGVVDDPLVLVDGLDREDTVAVKTRAPANDLWKFRIGHAHGSYNTSAD
jgi:hypothetical protein